jgi:hypothetical protein
MADVQTTRTTSVDRFWERFIDLERKNGGKDTAMRWYVRHAERYLKALSGERLADHRREDVTGYLESVGKMDGIADWQFRPIVDAVQVLLATANANGTGRGHDHFGLSQAELKAGYPRCQHRKRGR